MLKLSRFSSLLLAGAATTGSVIAAALLSGGSSTPQLSGATITTFAGGPGAAGPAIKLGQRPRSLAVKGNLVYVSDYANYCVRVIDTTTGTETVVAGTGAPDFNGDGGPATSASLGFFLQGVAVDSAGNIYIGDGGAANSPRGGGRVRKVDPSGTITTIAGNGTFGSKGDGGPATSAQLDGVSALTVDSAGNLYILTQYEGGRVRKVDKSGTITTVAGGGNPCISFLVPCNDGDGGPATSALLRFPQGITIDTTGNIYIADADGERIRKVDPAGMISTIAGNGQPGVAGDGGPASLAQVLMPEGVAVDAHGNVFIADTFNQRIRKIDSTGTISTVAGTGVQATSGTAGLQSLPS